MNAIVVTCGNHLCLNTCSLQITILTTFLGRGHTSLPSAPSSWNTTGFFNMDDLEGFGGGKGQASSRHGVEEDLDLTGVVVEVVDAVRWRFRNLE